MLKSRMRCDGVNIPKRLNAARYKSELAKKSLQKRCSYCLVAFKSSVHCACENVLRLCKHKHQDWFDTNGTELKLLLDIK